MLLQILHSRFLKQVSHGYKMTINSHNSPSVIGRNRINSLGMNLGSQLLNSPKKSSIEDRDNNPVLLSFVLNCRSDQQRNPYNSSH